MASARQINATKKRCTWRESGLCPVRQSPAPCGYHLLAVPVIPLRQAQVGGGFVHTLWRVYSVYIGGEGHSGCIVGLKF